MGFECLQKKEEKQRSCYRYKSQNKSRPISIKIDLGIIAMNVVTSMPYQTISIQILNAFFDVPTNNN